MYLFFVTLGTGLAYIGLFFLFPIFFNSASPKLHSRLIFPSALVMFASVWVMVVSLLIRDEAISNRFLHIIGGGFIPFLICFLVVAENKMRISKFRFFVFSFLIVSTFGVANEIFEFFLQHSTGIIFASSIDDTWLDLISNTIGAAFGAVCFTPFIKTK